MTRPRAPLSSRQAYSVAHTAQCRLHMTSSDPDRNLRFIIGHSFLLDKALMRVAEIEDLGETESGAGKGVLGDDNDAKQEQPPEGQSGSLAGGKVNFDNEVKESGDADAEREPSPAVEDTEDDGGELGLTRFPSASKMPPRMIQPDEDEYDEAEDDEPISPPSLPADFDVRALVQGDGDVMLSDMYELVRSCGCHDGSGEKCSKIWEVKGGERNGKRLAVMQVNA